MTVEEILSKMRKIQNSILTYIENVSSEAKNYADLIQLFENTHIRSNKYELMLTLRLLHKIAKNHHRGPNFFSKIEKIILFFKKDMNNYFSNEEIFNIFKNNIGILLFLFDQKIIMEDNRNTKIKCYLQIFQSLSFEENFMNGENDKEICEIIRSDNKERFISYVEKNNLSLDRYIPLSMIKSNSFYSKLKTINKTIIEYAAFFGSRQIIEYLLANNVKITSSVLIAAIHSQNDKLIDFLKKTDEKTYNECIETLILEAIKCHHNKFVNQNIQYVQNSKCFDEQSIKHINFAFIQQKEMFHHVFLYNLLRIGYHQIVNILLENNEIDVNYMKKYELKKEKEEEIELNFF